MRVIVPVRLRLPNAFHTPLRRCAWPEIQTPELVGPLAMLDYRRSRYIDLPVGCSVDARKQASLRQDDRGILNHAVVEEAWRPTNAVRPKTIGRKLDFPFANVTLNPALGYAHAGS